MKRNIGYKETFLAHSKELVTRLEVPRNSMVIFGQDNASVTLFLTERSHVH
jgi:hypothetical protein